MVYVILIEPKVEILEHWSWNIGSTSNSLLKTTQRISFLAFEKCLRLEMMASTFDKGVIIETFVIREV